MKAAGREHEIEKVIRTLKKEHPVDLPRDLAYVEGRLFHEYIDDMRIIQRFAALNRKAMVHPQLY